MLKKMSKRNLVISVLGSALLIQAGYNDKVFGTEITGVSKNNTTGAFDMKNLNLQKVMSQTSYSNI